MHADRFEKKFPEPLNEVRFIMAVVRIELYAPVSLDLDSFPGRGHQEISGLELMNSLYDTFGRRGGQETEKMIDRAPVKTALNLGKREKRLQFGCEHKPPRDHSVIQRLDSDSVPGNNHPSLFL